MPMRIVTFKIDEELLRRLDCLVEVGVFDNRSEAIREAIRRLVKEYGSCSTAAKARYRCPVCGEVLSLRELRRHVEKHIMDCWDGEGWRCPLCERKFNDRRELLLHLVNTADERHALLWALLPIGWHGKGYTRASRMRKELLKKLIVR